MRYPGHVVKLGEPDARIVRAVKTQLNRMLAVQRIAALKLDLADPNFGPKTKQAVQRFQASHVDTEGHPLKIDGELGSITWASLFGRDSVVSSDAASDSFLTRVLKIAAGEEAKRVRERPRNSNRGPEVEQYLSRAGKGPGLAWCCAFVYWCFDDAAIATARANPMVKTAGCIDHWNRAPSAGATRIPKSQAIADPSCVQPGMIFVMDFGSGAGHTGLVEQVEGGLMSTVEGNTDASKTREGGGVYRLHRKIVEVNKGFIDYGGV
jgi:hypothetical protein